MTRPRPLPVELWRHLEHLAAALAAAPPHPAQRHRSAREEALTKAAVEAVRAGYSPIQVARASGLEHRWLLDQRPPSSRPPDTP